MSGVCGAAVSRIAQYNGHPCLYINDIPQEGLAYITYLTENNRYCDFSSAGYRLFSVPVFFGFNHLNEHSGLDVFTRGIFDTDEPDFSVFDADVQRILDACPDGFILPRVNVSLSRRWELAHPDELCDPYSDGTPGRASFASDVWAEEVKREIGVFVEHIQNSSYASSIAGYQIAGGNTEEWLPLDKCGISGKRALEKYQSYLQIQQLADSRGAFCRFYSELVVQRICEFSAVIKDITCRNVVVGTFYGYTLEVTDPASGHHALRKLLDCENVDFICSPVSYSGGRASGRDHPYMLPIDSIRLHGKLYFSENDTRTHLSRPVNDMPWYNAPIWYGPDRQTSCNIIKLHAARALIKGHGAWWFDMWGGWFADERYMALLKAIREIFVNSRSQPMTSVAQVAVLVDEEAYAWAEDVSALGAVCSALREPFGKMGAPYDLYLASDGELVMDNYRAVISLKPTPSPNSDKIAAAARAKGLALLEITKENMDVTTGQLREFLRQANVHLWSDCDAVIYANESYVFLHTVADGVCPLHIPKDRILKDVLTGDIYDSERAYKKGYSCLFRYVDT